MELSSLDVRALALELRDLEDAFLDKVNQTAQDEFVFKLRQPQAGATYLVVRPGAYVARTAEPPRSPDQPTSLAMAMRKYLVGARIRRIDQHEFDRVLRFHLDRRGEAHELVVELFGKGNLLIAGPDGRLLLALRTETFAHRTVKRGEPLVFPPPRANPVTMSRSDLDALAERSEKDLVRFLALDLGLGGELAEETVHRAGLSKKVRASMLGPEDRDRLWTALRSLLDAPAAPAVVTGAKGVTVQSVAYTAPLFRDAQREGAATLSEAILRAAARPAAEPVEDKERARLERQVQHQERGILELQTEAERWERRGHILYAHYRPIAEVLQKAKASVEASGWGELHERHARGDAPPESWLRQVAQVDGKRARIVVALDGEEIPLDPFATIEANATLLYDESKRLRAKAEGAKVALADTRRRLKERPQAEAKPERARAKAPAKRFWFEAHRWFYTSEGFLVVGGRDAAGNEKLVKRHLAPGDRYFHADFHGAPSVVLKAEGREPGEASLSQAGAFAAVYSRAFAQFATADAYWVRPEQVSKTAESGEYVPKGSFVIRGQRNYSGKQKMEVALGLVHLDAQGRPGDGPHARLMGGPPAAVAHHAPRHARLERGEQKPTDAAKELAPLFRVTIDEVVAALPPGTVRIVARPEARP